MKYQRDDDPFVRIIQEAEEILANDVANRKTQIDPIIQESERLRIESLFDDQLSLANVLQEAEKLSEYLGDPLDIDVKTITKEIRETIAQTDQRQRSLKLLSIPEAFGDDLEIVSGGEPIVILAITYSENSGRNLLHLVVKTGMISNIVLSPKTVSNWNEVNNSDVDVDPIVGGSPDIEIALLPSVQDSKGGWHADYDADPMYVPISKIIGIYHLYQTDNDSGAV